MYPQYEALGKYVKICTYVFLNFTILRLWKEVSWIPHISRKRSTSSSGILLCIWLQQSSQSVLTNVRRDIHVMTFTSNMHFELARVSGKGNSCSVSEVTCTLWNMKFHYRVHKSQINPVITLPSSGLHLDMPNDLLPSALPAKTLYAFLFSLICPIFPAHLILHDLITLIVFGRKYKL